MEFHVIEDGRLNPETTNWEKLSTTKLVWIWLSKGLAVIQDEDAEVISQGEDDRVSDWWLKGKNHLHN